MQDIQQITQQDLNQQITSPSAKKQNQQRKNLLSQKSPKSQHSNNNITQTPESIKSNGKINKNIQNSQRYKSQISHEQEVQKEIQNLNKKLRNINKGSGVDNYNILEDNKYKSISQDSQEKLMTKPKNNNSNFHEFFQKMTSSNQSNRNIKQSNKNFAHNTYGTQQNNTSMDRINFNNDQFYGKNGKYINNQKNNQNYNNSINNLSQQSSQTQSQVQSQNQSLTQIKTPIHIPFSSKISLYDQSQPSGKLLQLSHRVETSSQRAQQNYDGKLQGKQKAYKQKNLQNINFEQFNLKPQQTPKGSQTMSHSKNLKSELQQHFEQFNKMTNSNYFSTKSTNKQISTYDKNKKKQSQSTSKKSSISFPEQKNQNQNPLQNFKKIDISQTEFISPRQEVNKINIHQQSSISTHSGPFNLRCISYKHPKVQLQDIIKSLKQFKIEFKQTNLYELELQKNQVKFTIQIKLLEKTDNLYYIHFHKTIGDHLKYNNYCNMLLNSISN